MGFIGEAYRTCQPGSMPAAGPASRKVLRSQRGVLWYRNAQPDLTDDM